MDQDPRPKGAFTGSNEAVRFDDDYFLHSYPHIRRVDGKVYRLLKGEQSPEMCEIVPQLLSAFGAIPAQKVWKINLFI